MGPGGIGLIQLFTTTIALINSVFSLGLGFSGVRDISENISSGDSDAVAKTIVTLKRWVWFSGLVGIIVTVIISKNLSQWAFGNEDHWVDISLLSVTIIFTNLAASHVAIIRGARRMVDFAKINILSAIASIMVAVPLYYFLKDGGIIPVLIITSVIGLIISIVYSKKISYSKVKITFKESFFSGVSMVQLGIFTVITGFITRLTLYYVYISIGEKLGVDSVGYYAVASTLAISYMGLIFTAMGADYFPKLSAINKDDKAINAAVLEQTKIILLLGTPLIIVMYTFSEYIIQILYSDEFIAALPLLMWMLLSVFLRLIGFPIGYVFLAKGKSKIYIFTQSLWNVAFLLLTYLSWQYKGDLEGVGIAYTIAYIIGVTVNVIIIKRLTQFEYDKETLRYILIFSVITITYFYVSYSYNGWYILSFKVIGGGLFILYSFKQVERLIGVNLIAVLRDKLKI